MNPGNPALGYLKSFGDETNFFYGKQWVEDQDKWSEMPLKDLPLKQISDWRFFLASALKNADDAARLDTPDWQILSKLKSEGCGLRLSELGEMRRLSMVLKVRLRAEIAERHFDKALVTVKTIFAMSRHLCEHPTLVGNQVGITILQETAMGPLEEMLQQPGCPNLYWALSALPSPLLSIYKGMQGERLMFTPLLLPIDERTPMTDEQLQKVVDRFDELIALTGKISKMGDIRKSVNAKAKDEARLTAARKQLSEAGFDPKKLKQFPPLQVILLNEMLAFRERRDDDMKAMMLPYWQIQSSLGVGGANEGENGQDRRSLFVFLFPPDKARREQARLEQRIALLRCVEALRMYAADHDGQLPARFDDVPVPGPIDPVSGMPFTYTLDGATATVRGTPVQREAWYTFYNFNAYEVTMKK